MNDQDAYDLLSDEFDMLMSDYKKVEAQRDSAHSLLRASHEALEPYEWAEELVERIGAELEGKT